MKFRSELALAVALALTLGTGLVHAQGGTMMNGGGGYGSWMGGSGSWMGGYGGLWIPILLVVIVGLVVWIVMNKRK